MNNNYYPIEEIVEQLRCDYSWSHSFIRECYLTTEHSFFEKVDETGNDSVVEADAPQNARLIVASSGNPANLGIEFIFRDVGIFAIAKLYELSFDYKYDKHTAHTVCFAGSNNHPECFFTAKSVDVRFLGRSYQGIDLCLGFEYPSAEAVDAKKCDDCWRLCGNCSNAWEERPNVEFSRCPSCGLVTKLTD